MAKALTADSKRFYEASKFAVTQKAFGTPEPLAFPDYLLMSRNYYEESWAFTTKKRLKNVVVIMEWVPAASDLAISSGSRTFDEAELAQLRTIFDLFDTDGSGTISADELVEVLVAIGITGDAQSIVAALLAGIHTSRADEDDEASFENFVDILGRESLFQVSHRPCPFIRADPPSAFLLNTAACEEERVAAN